jgi:hypothetical protein
MSAGATKVSYATLWTVSVFFAVMGFLVICGLLKGKGHFGDGLIWIMILSIPLRICLFVEFPILFHRVNQTWNLT